MAELKRDFSQAKMNKDMDERVVPSGQYRDAKNIQIATSDGSNVGSLQTLLGNTDKTTGVVNADYSTCVGVLPLPEKDLIYYFIAGGGTKNYEPLRKKDYIIEYNTITEETRYIFVDIYSVTHTIATDQASSDFIEIAAPTYYSLGIRPGMELKGTLNDPNGAGQHQIGINANWGVTVTDIKKVGSNYRIFHSGSTGLLNNGSNFYCTAGDTMTFFADRVLKFDHHRKITAINHLDGMIFWTDNKHEPRKINIERSFAGTCGNDPLDGWTDTNLWSNQPSATGNPQPASENNDDYHTRLCRKNESVSNAFLVALNSHEEQPIFAQEADITVIKRNPLYPLEVEMSTTENKRKDTNGDENPIFATTTSLDLGDGASEPVHLEVGDQITLDLQTPVDYRAGDTIMLTSQLDLAQDNFPLDKVEARIKILSGPVNSSNPNASTGTFNAEIQSIDFDAPMTATNWLSRLEQVKPLFEYKFPRFSYRYKYTDGEYSTFAPWSEIAFLPGDFDYMPKKGYNLGMTNRVRYITLKNYFHEHGLVPDDVIEVDLLYKETQSTTVYTMKTLSRKDGAPLWPDMKTNFRNRGEFQIDSEMIHAVVPSNQLLRPYDNVPRYAKAQEITANRLVYGNYKQNYNIDQTLKLNVQHSAYDIPDSSIEDYEIPLQSLKSMRTYQVGVVWLDDYGRESPVMVPAEGGSITVPKKDSFKQNRLKAKILEKSNGGGDPPPWARYMKYYIKETSNEYYNLAMDRFYDAEDGNVWLSFPSAERNKVAQDTYLILKKQHDSNMPVTESARYRVIAISNEAPLFIKRKRKSYGMSTVEFSATGLPEEGRSFILVTQSQFLNSFGGVVSPDLKDNLQLRIGGVDGSVVYTSEVYDITGIANNSGGVRITLSSALGAECAPISILNRTTQMRLEIFENKFEDKPEFDGRFFVKILKDLTLEKELLSSFSERIDYVVSDVMKVGFMCDHNGSNETYFTNWRNWHNGDHRSDRSRWYIDDQDCGPGGGSNNIGSSEINRGGIYNARPNLPNNAQGDTGGATVGIMGHGYIDLSYGNFNQSGGPNSEGNKFQVPYNRLRTIGTLFRFKEDPAQVVFRIDGVQGRLRSSLFDGEGAALFKYTRNKNSTGWESESGAAGGGCLIGSSGDSEWNYASSGVHRDDHDNQRWSMRIKVDKMFGSGPNHIFDSANHAPMSKPNPDPDGDPIMLVDGDRYDGAVVAANGITNAAGSSITTPVGHYHNWYPITSDTGLELNTANQLVAAPRASIGGGFPGGYTHYSPLRYSALGSSHSYGLGPQTGSGNHHARITIEFLEPQIFTTEDGGAGGFLTNNPAIWETEPKEDVGLDIYYEASGAIPINPDHTENELLLPLGSTMTWQGTTYKVMAVNSYSPHQDVTRVTLSPNLVTSFPHDHWSYFTRYDGSKICLISNQPGGTAAASGQPYIHFVTGDNAVNLGTFMSEADSAPHHNPMVLGWHNCYSFGNGVESDRIRDDFNAKRIDNGVKASTTLSEPYAEEHRSSGFIWSGIFNSTSGVNNLNQFIQAEPITKDLNPSYGTIQKMVARNTNTLAFCEDKVLKILTNKDALFNADGNSNVTSTAMVLGQAVPLPGEYGISTNPESLTPDPDGFYWADVMRGNVLTLKGDQIVSISDMGMKDYFNDNMKDLSSVVGVFDEKKKEYSISLLKKAAEQQWRPTGVTLSFSQKSGGWVSFKDFLPEHGISLNNEFYTWSKGSIWQHHTNTTRNNFYGVQYNSDVTLLFNDQPGSVKSFGTINYEGSAAAITSFTQVNTTNAANQALNNLNDSEYYNLWNKTGWYVEDVITNLQDTGLLEFKNKEGKYFSTVQGKTTELANLDEREFSVQGLGNFSETTVTGDPPGQTYKIYVQGVHTNDIGNGPASSNHASWDSGTADSPNWKVIFKPALNAVSGTTVTAGSYASYITNEYQWNGSAWVNNYSGLDLDAKNYSCPGGTATTSGSGNATKYIYTQGGSMNADADILKVEFSNVFIDAAFNETPGIPNDPANRVKCEIFWQNYAMPTADKILKCDVDSSVTSNPRGVVARDACVRVSYSEIPSGSVTSGNDRVAISYADLAGFTETADVNFLSDPLTTIKHSGTANEYQMTEVARYTVTADSGYYLTEIGSGPTTGCEASWFQRLANAAWTGSYTFNYTNTYYTSTGNTTKIQSTVVKIYYSPPVGAGWEAGDPTSGEGGFCAHLHDVRLEYLARPISSTTKPTKANTLNATPKHVASGDDTTLNIYTSAAGNLGIVVKKPTSGEGNHTYATLSKTTQNEIDVWTTTWATADGPVVNTIACLEGSNEIDLTLDTAASATLLTYNVYGVDLGGDGLDLATAFPTASSTYDITSQTNISTSITATMISDMSMFSGTNVISNAFTGKPNTTLDTPLKQQIYLELQCVNGKSLTIARQPDILDIIGGNFSCDVAVDSNSGATTILMSLSDIDGIATGMTVSGEGIAPDTTVTNINSRTITVSKAITADIPQGTALTFRNGFGVTSDLYATKISTTRVNIGGTISMTKFGSTGGNLTIKTGNFLTIS